MTAFSGARVFDGERWHDGALLTTGDTVDGIGPAQSGATDLGGGMIVPGFVDLQVNGGGGALLNDTPTLEAIRTICSAHARYGTTALLPTLVTDTPAITAKAVAAGIEARGVNVPGFLGLHLEGPHLSVARKGAHDPNLIRPMEQEDLVALVAARRALPHLLSTVAAETVTPLQIEALTSEGVVVSIGHSDASFATLSLAAEAGASMVTHLFNAQSQIGNREPGVAGAALAIGTLNAGLIADGIHVHPETIAIALRAKRGAAGRIFLVTDAMSVTGTDATEFTLNGRRILRRDRALRLEDGTLAGADLTMIEAIAFMHRTIGLSLDEALRMATVYPADAIGAPQYGHLRSGARADFVHLGDDLSVRSTWIGGERVFPQR